MKIKIINIVFLLFLSATIFGQKKINTDSLLIKTNELIRSNGNPKLIVKLCHLGIKNAPNYLDYHVNLGRIYTQTKTIDSARYYFNYVIDKNKKYKDAYIYLTNLEISQNNIETAISKINEAEKNYPDDKEVLFQKIKILLASNDYQEAKNYITELSKKYPDDSYLKQQMIQIRNLEKSETIGINYSLTTFDRSGVGPWHLTGLQYGHQGNKLSLIGMINYANRTSNGVTFAQGFQFEIESYLKHNHKNYSMLNAAFSNGKVFPEFRMAYSYFQGFSNGWEPEIGFRYTKTTNQNIYGGVLGCTKYVGSFWLNLRTFWQYNQNKIYPAAQFSTRYYFDTRYDYLNAFIGYGSSPDEREILGVFDQRFTLSSYRFGIGYHKLFGNHFIGGIQGNINRQQYNLNNYQNEYTISTVLQYKF